MTNIGIFNRGLDGELGAGGMLSRFLGLTNLAEGVFFVAGMSPIGAPLPDPVDK
jgi:hypothetical protein